MPYIAVIQSYITSITVNLQSSLTFTYDDGSFLDIITDDKHWWQISPRFALNMHISWRFTAHVSIQ